MSCHILLPSLPKLGLNWAGSFWITSRYGGQKRWMDKRKSARSMSIVHDQFHDVGCRHLSDPQGTSRLAFTFLLPIKVSRTVKENQRISSDFFTQRKGHALFSSTIRNSVHTIPRKNKKCLYIINVHSLLKMFFVKHISFIHFKLEEPLYFKNTHSYIHQSL
jgi:hypothetical protein